MDESKERLTRLVDAISAAMSRSGCSTEDQAYACMCAAAAAHTVIRHDGKNVLEMRRMFNSLNRLMGHALKNECGIEVSGVEIPREDYQPPAHLVRRMEEQ